MAALGRKLIATQIQQHTCKAACTSHPCLAAKSKGKFNQVKFVFLPASDDGDERESKGSKKGIPEVCPGMLRRRRRTICLATAGHSTSNMAQCRPVEQHLILFNALVHTKCVSVTYHLSFDGCLSVLHTHRSTCHGIRRFRLYLWRHLSRHT